MVVGWDLVHMGESQPISPRLTHSGCLVAGGWVQDGISHMFADGLGHLCLASPDELAWACPHGRSKVPEAWVQNSHHLICQILFVRASSKTSQDSRGGEMVFMQEAVQ